MPPYNQDVALVTNSTRQPTSFHRTLDHHHHQKHTVGDTLTHSPGFTSSSLPIYPFVLCIRM